ncbi:hypothetical protein [Micromonospora sp. CB01531]|uniref:hypothetical protein n=1 Tax=Micromonospora sp. CB01531 TaxID=1718947 RepID=UPI00093D787C|nr:hypothetical protein [Micromonospora sp. CB01531]OKI89294.1 hypothetical protein A6A27_01010 [Micromonospora sp. CB01531]
MAISLPRPGAVVGLTRSALDQALGSAAAFAAVPARAFAVLDDVEALLRRINGVVDRIEGTLDRTDRVLTDAEAAVREVGVISAAATGAIETATEVATAAAAVVGEADAVALSPEEVTAAIRLVDELPKLKEHLTSDVLPILATLDRVGPDLHDLLAVTRDLKLAVAGIPGLGMLRRRGERLVDDPTDRDAAAN